MHIWMSIQTDVTDLKVPMLVTEGCYVEVNRKIVNLFSYISLCFILRCGFVIRNKCLKNNLTMGGGSGEGTVRRGDYRNYYKGHMDKIKGEGGDEGRRAVWLGWGGGMGRKGTQL